MKETVRDILRPHGWNVDCDAPCVCKQNSVYKQIVFIDERHPDRCRIDIMRGNPDCIKLKK